MDRIQRGLMYLEDLDFMRIVGVSAVDVLSRENERAILSFTSVGFDKCICGHRQVVRHQLPKLTFAGSSPVARSMDFIGLTIS